MDASLKPLLDAAFASGPAPDANALIEKAREAVAGEKTRNYELLVPEGAGAAWFCEKVLPRLVYHLESLGARPPEAPGVFLTLFSGDRVFFVHGRDAMAYAAEKTGLSAQQMLQKWGTGELREAVSPKRSGPPLALPGPDKDR